VFPPSRVAAAPITITRCLWRMRHAGPTESVCCLAPVPAPALTVVFVGYVIKHEMRTRFVRRHVLGKAPPCLVRWRLSHRSLGRPLTLVTLITVRSLTKPYPERLGAARKYDGPPDRFPCDPARQPVPTRAPRVIGLVASWDCQDVWFGWNWSATVHRSEA